MKKEKLPFKVERAVVFDQQGYSTNKRQSVFVPAGQSVKKLQEMDLTFGQTIFFEITKPRTVEFNGKAHVFGSMVSENISDFHNLSSHKVLKRLQLEGNIACEEIGIMIPGCDELIIQKIPKSLAFDSMDENEFRKVYNKFCDLIVERYWDKIPMAKINAMGKIMEFHP